MRRSDQINIWIFRIAAVLLCLTMISVYMTGGLYAKYTATAEGGDGARVAAFVFDVNDVTEEEHFVDVSEVNEPGKSKTFQFLVRNYNTSRSSEVAENYQLFAELHGSLPLTVTVTGDDETNMNLTNSAAQVAESSVNSFQAGEQGKHTYTVTVTWPESEKDLQYANAGLSEVVLRISAWQVD